MIGQQLSLFDDPLPAEISQEEIDRCLGVGSSFCFGKERIFHQFQKGESAEENARFLKKEYGIGGLWPAYPCDKREDEVSLDYNGQGIEIRRLSDRSQGVKFTWAKVEQRIRYLIDAGLYTVEE